MKKSNPNNYIKNNNSINKENISSETNDLLAKEIFGLFSKRKFKSVCDKIKSNPELINIIINDEKTLLQYAVQTNNKKLVKKLFDIDGKSILQTNLNNLMLPHFALENGLTDMFFYLIDRIIE